MMPPALKIDGERIEVTSTPASTIVVSFVEREISFTAPDISTAAKGVAIVRDVTRSELGPEFAPMALEGLRTLTNITGKGPMSQQRGPTPILAVLKDDKPSTPTAEISAHITRVLETFTVEDLNKRSTVGDTSKDTGL